MQTKHLFVLIHFRNNGEVGTVNNVSKGAKIRNRYNQVPHLTQDTNGKVTKSQLDTANESQEVSPYPAGDHKAHINKRAQGDPSFADPFSYLWFVFVCHSLLSVPCCRVAPAWEGLTSWFPCM